MDTMPQVHSNKGGFDRRGKKARPWQLAITLHQAKALKAPKGQSAKRRLYCEVQYEQQTWKSGEVEEDWEVCSPVLDLTPRIIDLFENSFWQAIVLDCSGNAS